MKMLETLKARFPRIVPTLIALSAVTALGGAAAYQKLADDDCCELGAPCCHPGAACCAKHHAKQQ
jgi:hypothetical protein